MSYDVVFFDDTSKCDYSAYAVYCRLRRGLSVAGLRPVNQEAVVDVLKQVAQLSGQNGEILRGRMGDASIEIQLRSDALLIDLRNVAGDEVGQLEDALRPLGLQMFEPQTYHYYGDRQDEIYGLSYDEESHDPDPRYWVEASLLKTDSFEMNGTLKGYQDVNGVLYAFYDAPFDVIKEMVVAGMSWLPIDALTDISFTEGDSLTGIVAVPRKLITHLADQFNPRMHLSGFTAFADDDEVFSYWHWGTDFDGNYAVIHSLPTMPTRFKTIISKKFSFKG